MLYSCCTRDAVANHGASAPPAGFAQVMVPDPDGPPLEAGIWYPSNAPASSHRLALYTQAVALDGEVAPEGCRDPVGFDRAAFDREFNSAVVAFFNAKLHS